MDVRTAFRIQIFSIEIQRLNCAESLEGRYCCQDVRVYRLRSTFDSDHEMWIIEGFYTDDPDWHTQDPRIDEVQYDASVGNPGGSLYRSEEIYGITEYFSSPESFLGDKGFIFGGYLSFDLRQSEVREEHEFNAPDVMLESNTTVLLHVFGSPPQVDWTSYQVDLDESFGWNHLDGSPASENDLREVISDLTAVRIRVVSKI